MRGHEHDAPGTHTPNPSSACPVHFPFQRWGAPSGASQCLKGARLRPVRTGYNSGCASADGFHHRRRAGRLPARPAPRRARPAGGAPAARARRRIGNPPARRGAGSPRTAWGAPARPPVDLPRLHRRLGGPVAGVRPALPAAIVAGARTLGAHRPGPAAGRVAAADLGLPGGEPALRRGRPSPRVGRAGARSDAHRRLRDRGAHRASRRRPEALRTPPQEPRAPVLRAHPAASRGPQAHPPLRSVGLRVAGRGRGGLGLSRHPGAT